jgi:hypothetical protein
VFACDMCGCQWQHVDGAMWCHNSHGPLPLASPPGPERLALFFDNIHDFINGRRNNEMGDPSNPSLGFD